MLEKQNIMLKIQNDRLKNNVSSVISRNLNPINNNNDNHNNNSKHQSFVLSPNELSQTIGTLIKQHQQTEFKQKTQQTQQQQQSHTTTTVTSINKNANTNTHTNIPNTETQNHHNRRESVNSCIINIPKNVEYMHDCIEKQTSLSKIDIYSDIINEINDNEKKQNNYNNNYNNNEDNNVIDIKFNDFNLDPTFPLPRCVKCSHYNAFFLFFLFFFWRSFCFHKHSHCFTKHTKQI